MISYSSELDYYQRPRPQQELIDEDKFRQYLESIYVLKKSDQNRIIRFYKIGVKENRRGSYLRQALEELDYPDVAINSILRYIACWNARVQVDKQLEGQNAKSR